MKKRVGLLLSYACFWLVFFLTTRLIFGLYEHQESFKLSINEWGLSFLHGFQHDLSITGYILTLVGLFMCFTFGSKTTKPLEYFLKVYTLILLPVFLLILIPNLELYRNWGFHLDISVLSYLKNPKEATASTKIEVYSFLIILICCLAFSFYYFFRKLIQPQISKLKPVKLYYLPVWLIIVASLIIPIRGGIGIAPLNVGTVYYSLNPFANHLAVNPVWNFLYSVKKLEKDDEAYNYMADVAMKTKIDSLFKGDGKYPIVLKNKRPNVIVLLLESFTSKVIEPLGGKPGVTPNLNKLCQEGILFDNFYSSGDRSKKGIVAVFSGYPPLPKNAIISFSQKTQKIPSLGKEFNRLGYHSSFYYGGDLNFASMNSYIINSGFQKIKTMFDYPKKDYNSKWGVHDEIMFDDIYNDIEREKGDGPFFKAFFNLSSHEPFDVPMKTVIKGNDEDSQFMNSVYYSDQCLGKFIEKAKKSSWWNNTLIILVADHGTRYVGNSGNSDPSRYKIPMLWIGGALKLQGERISKYGCQPDLISTLLPQMGLSARKYIFGKNLLDQGQKGFAFYDYENGFGFLTPKSEQIYDFTGKRYVANHSNDKKNDGITWKALIQYLYKDFMSR